MHRNHETNLKEKEQINLRKLLKPTIVAAIVQFCCITFFAFFASRTNYPMIGKIVSIALFFTSFIYISFWVVRIFSLKYFLFIAALFAISQSIIENILAFAWFPGLMKDVDFFSSSHFMGFLCWIVFLFICYSILLVVTKLLVHFLSKYNMIRSNLSI